MAQIFKYVNNMTGSEMKCNNLNFMLSQLKEGRGLELNAPDIIVDVISSGTSTVDVYNNLVGEYQSISISVVEDIRRTLFGRETYSVFS